MTDEHFDLASKTLGRRLSKYLTVIRDDVLELEDIRSLSAEDLEHLANAISSARYIQSVLMNYTIINEQFPAISRALQENLNLRKVEISATNLHEKITCFYHMLSRTGAVITKLAFFDTKLTCKDMQMLSEGLKRNNSLVALDLMCNDFGVEGCKYLSEGLQQHKAIEYLAVAGNLISSEGSKYLASILKETSSLTFLDLSNNLLDAESMQYFADSLYGNTTLKRLVVSNNVIRDQGCLHLTKILDHCPSLTELDIAINSISALGFSELSKALRRNNSLRTFLASANRGGDHVGMDSEDTGFADLCSALEYNTSLTVLDLSRNTNLGLLLPYLVKVMRANRSLLKVTVQDSQLPAERSPELKIAWAVKRNNEARKKQVKEIITVLLNMARQTATLEIFPLEIWLTIFKYFSVPGIPSFDQPARYVFLNAKNIVAMLRSGATMKFIVKDAALQLDIANTKK